VLPRRLELRHSSGPGRRSRAPILAASSVADW
jgi:hypothetical protein